MYVLVILRTSTRWKSRPETHKVRWYRSNPYDDTKQVNKMVNTPTALIRISVITIDTAPLSLKKMPEANGHAFVMKGEQHDETKQKQKKSS